MENDKFSVQEQLSLGYLALVGMGLFDNILYYRMLGINIIDYITVSDVLLSPINTINQNGKTLLAFLLAVVISFGFVYWVPALHKKYRSGHHSEAMERLASLPGHTKARMALSFMIGIFIGVKTANSLDVKWKIDAGTYSMTHKIFLNGQEPANIYMVGKNSGYIFYIPENQKGHIRIVPIGDNVLGLEQL